MEPQKVFKSRLIHGILRVNYTLKGRGTYEFY